MHSNKCKKNVLTSVTT